MLYFIGYNLQDESAALVDVVRNSIAEKFSVHASLRFPSHLTFLRPFEMDDGFFDDLKRTLSDFASKRSAFEVSTVGFNSFDEAVWFLDVDQKQELFDMKKDLSDLLLQSSLLTEEQVLETRGVHFHITLAYKDMTPEKFKLIGKYLASLDPINEKLNINAITLFVNKGQSWDVLETFGFKNN